MAFRIPFHVPGLAGGELCSVADGIARGQTVGDGASTALCHKFLQRELGVPRALLATSCTHALEIAVESRTGILSVAGAQNRPGYLLPKSDRGGPQARGEEPGTLG